MLSLSAVGTNPLRNQTSVVPGGSSSASATLEVGRSASSCSFREGNTSQPGEKSTSNPYETPQKNKEKVDHVLVAKDKPKDLTFMMTSDKQAGASQGQGNPGGGTSQGGTNY